MKLKPKGYYTVLEVAEIFGVIDNTVYGWIKRGLMTAWRPGPRMVLISEKEIAKFKKPEVKGIK